LEAVSIVKHKLFTRENAGTLDDEGAEGDEYEDEEGEKVEGRRTPSESHSL